MGRLCRATRKDDLQYERKFSEIANEDAPVTEFAFS